jgi:hypothetical protein
VAVAQGVRFATEPTLRSLDSYSCEKTSKVFHKRQCLESTDIVWTTTFARANTKIIREVGGFPSDCPVCTDGILLESLHKRGYNWLIDKKSRFNTP